MDEDFGRVMHCHAFSLACGAMTELNWRGFLAELTQAIGMKPMGSPSVWHYPTEDGAGGNGITLFQPITESYLALDAWPDHKGAYLQICSCRSFEIRQVKEVLWKWKLSVHSEVGHTLRIPVERARPRSVGTGIEESHP